MFHKAWFALVVVIPLAIFGCGGGGSSPAPSAVVTPPTPSPAPGGAPTPATVPIIVSVGSQPVTGIDINVSTPASSTPPNAQFIGVGAFGAIVKAANTGTTISRSGGAMTVILFGPGLNGNMSVTIGGPPQDFMISNIRSKTATDHTPGIAFDVIVSPTAALGARSVILRSINDDITTFTGGLEVIP